MFCTNCGNKIEPEQNFCTSCGSPASSAKKEIQRDVQRQASQTAKKQWTTGRLIKYAVVAVIVAGLLVLKFGIVAYNASEGESIRTNDSGITALNSGDTQSAIDNFKNAAENASYGENKMNALKNLGYAYSVEYRNEEAIEAFREALTYADSGSFEFYLINGEIQYLQGNPESALNNYELAYQKQPNNFQVNNAISLLYIDIDDWYPEYYDAAKAIPYALSAYQNCEPEMKSTMAQNLGVAYHFNQEYGNAIKYFKLAGENDPTNMLWLGLAYTFNGDEATGFDYIQRARANGVEIPPEIEEIFY